MDCKIAKCKTSCFQSNVTSTGLRAKAEVADKPYHQLHLPNSTTQLEVLEAVQDVPVISCFSLGFEVVSTKKGKVDQIYVFYYFISRQVVLISVQTKFTCIVDTAKSLPQHPNFVLIRR